MGQRVTRQGVVFHGERTFQWQSAQIAVAATAASCGGSRRFLPPILRKLAAAAVAAALLLSVVVVAAAAHRCEKAITSFDFSPFDSNHLVGAPAAGLAAARSRDLPPLLFTTGTESSRQPGAKGGA